MPSMKNVLVKVDMSKRIFDLLILIPLLPLAICLFVVLSLLVYLFLGRPIIFTQQRPGKNSNPFILYKFRTMKNNSSDEGSEDDALRLTRFGKLLRRSSLDELPELWNVIRGDMSVVGPRPLLMEYLPLYSTNQARRHEILPGITGWAQINGRNNLSWEEKFELDIWYVENRSILLDLRILFRTVFKVLASRDINHSGHATSKKFRGSSFE